MGDRTIPLTTAAEVEHVRQVVAAGGGIVWLVRPGGPGDEFRNTSGQYVVETLPPVVFVAACQPCTEPMCRNGRVLYPEWEGRDQPCSDCRTELVGPCLACESMGAVAHGAGTTTIYNCHNGSVTVAHGYVIGQPLPIVATRHSPPPEELPETNARWDPDVLTVLQSWTHRDDIIASFPWDGRYEEVQP